MIQKNRPAANLLRACCDIRMFGRNTKMLISVFPSVSLRPENLESVRLTQTGESGISPSQSKWKILIPVFSSNRRPVSQSRTSTKISAVTEMTHSTRCPPKSERSGVASPMCT